MTILFYFRLALEENFQDECDRLRRENDNLRTNFDEQIESLNERIKLLNAENIQYIQVIIVKIMRHIQDSKLF